MMPRNTAKLVNAITALRCLINKPATNNTTSSTMTKANRDAQSRNRMAHTDTARVIKIFVNGTKRSICPSYFLPN